MILSYTGKTYCDSCCGLLEMEAAERTDRRNVWPKPRDLIGDKPVEEWPWRSILTLERRWLQRHLRNPKCLICGGPLVCGQSATHYTCEQIASAIAGSGG